MAPLGSRTFTYTATHTPCRSIRFYTHCHIIICTNTADTDACNGYDGLGGACVMQGSLSPPVLTRVNEYQPRANHNTQTRLPRIGSPQRTRSESSAPTHPTGRKRKGVHARAKPPAALSQSTASQPLPPSIDPLSSSIARAAPASPSIAAV